MDRDVSDDVAYRDYLLHVSTYQLAGGWTFVVGIRDRAGHLVKTVRSDDLVFLTPPEAEKVGLEVARTWINDANRK